MRYRKANHTVTGDPGAYESLTDRSREAERILGQSLDTARGEAPGPVTSFAILRTLVESRARRHASSKESRFMSAIKQPLTAHRKLSFGIVSAVLVFAFATLVPFEYQQTIGYQATFAGIDPSSGLNAELLEGVLDALGYQDTEFDLHTVSDELRCRIRDLPSRYAAREVAAAIASVIGFAVKPEVEPQMETVSGSLYAQVKCELSNIDDFDFEGKTEEEIKTEIERRLAAQGCDSATVTVRTMDAADGKEKRQICVQVRDESGTSGAICSAGFFDGLDVDAKDKTDAEVEAEIRKHLEAKGQTNVEVSVTTRADGRRRIEIKCKPD